MEEIILVIGCDLGPTLLSSDIKIYELCHDGGLLISSHIVLLMLALAGNHPT